MARVLVVGGANTDITGVARAAFIPADSNPGVVRSSAGGVGRNIAENLARLGASVELITAFGDDAMADELRAHCERAGIDTSRSAVVPGASGSVYLALLDADGALVGAVSDMRALAGLTPAVLEGALREDAPQPDALVLDANLSPAALETAATTGRRRGVPVFADCVSVAKCARLEPLLGSIDCLHANALEAEALTGVAVTGDSGGAARAAARLHERGVGLALVTDGPRGVFYSSAAGRGLLAVPAAEVVNVTGAGDAFMAAVVWGTLSGRDPRLAAAIGAAAALFTLRRPETVVPDLDPASVLAYAEELAR